MVFAELLSGRLVVCCYDGTQQRTPCDDTAPPLRVLSAWSHACPALLQLVPQHHTTRCDVLMFLVHPRVPCARAQCLHSPHGMQLQRVSTVFDGLAPVLSARSHPQLTVFWGGVAALTFTALQKDCAGDAGVPPCGYAAVEPCTSLHFQAAGRGCGRRCALVRRCGRSPR